MTLPPTRIVDKSAHTPEIWLGGDHNNEGVVSCMNCIVSVLPSEYLPNYFYNFPPEQRLHIPIEDTISASVLPHVPQFITFMEKHKDKRIYVHCQMGISRSATFVIIYLIYKYPGYKCDDTINFVKMRRYIVQPNPKFLNEIKKFYNDRYRKEADCVLC